MRTVVHVPGSSGTILGERLARDLGARFAGATGASFTSGLRESFRLGETIIGVCASGILIRVLAPLLSDKSHDPPVLAVSEDGAVVVPLLGGHYGANELALRVAALTGGHAAITTASEVRFGASLDAPAGYTLANPQHLKGFLAALLAGEGVRAEGEAPFLAGLPIASHGALCIRITDRTCSADRNKLVYHPRVLAVGVGCERGTAPGALVGFVRQELAAAGLAEQSVACIASLDLKADEPAVTALAEALGVPARYFTAAELNAESSRLRNPSETVRREVGCPGVAEGAALRSGGRASELVVEKTVRAGMTCAVARSSRPIDPEAVGRPRGCLSIIGLGPGDPLSMTLAACRALDRATDWVGYRRYLDLIEGLRSGQRRHGFALGEEEERARWAIDLAAEGREVALVSSGDAGIYAMAAVIYELLDPGSVTDLPAAAYRVAIEVIPGISAFQAAAAKAGAMIGHDFCCISLSDLMTPWQSIERRLRAAAEADFVIALYNPRSQRRRDQLERALAIVSLHRSPRTPVIVAASLGREGETVSIVSLQDFDAATIDMLTLVMIGSSRSKSLVRGDGSSFAYTPRGYDLSPHPARRKLEGFPS
jgi:cobalt-precorrin 5A hydrolase/precorrin-3B C17-methyltransferase